MKTRMIVHSNKLIQTRQFVISYWNEYTATNRNIVRRNEHYKH